MQSKCIFDAALLTTDTTTSVELLDPQSGAVDSVAQSPVKPSAEARMFANARTLNMASPKMLGRDIRDIRFPSGFRLFSTAASDTPPSPEPPQVAPLFCRRVVKGSVIFHAYTVNLTEESVRQDYDLVVYAHTVNVFGHLWLPGRRVAIFANQVVSGENGFIDVSGGDPEGPSDRPRLPDQPQSAGTDGLPGSDGKPGEKGNAGGEIRIFAGRIDGDLGLAADGGTGQQGQDAGDANDGIRGRDGADGGGEVRRTGPGEFGGKGGNGGAQGRGGDGGPGGDGGRITVALVKDGDSTGIVTPHCEPGLGGKPGANGRRGNGGPGGTGGVNTSTQCRDRMCDSGEHCWVQRDARQPSGPSGDQGAEVPQEKQPHTGGPGEPGVVETVRIGLADLGKFAALPQLRMVLQKAEELYYEETYSEAVLLLSWLDRLTEDAPGSRSVDVLDPSHPVGTPLEATEGDWAIFRNRVLQLQAQLATGLDFYGQPKNYVSLVDYRIYAQLIEKLLPFAKSLSDAYTDYWKAELSEEERRERVRTAIGEARRAAERREMELDRLRLAIGEGEALVQEIRAVMNQQREILANTFNDLEEFVWRMEHEGKECSFSEVLTLVATVVTIGSSLYGGVLGVIQQAEQFAKPHQGPEARIKIVKAAAGKFDEIAAAWKQVKDLNAVDPGSAVIAIDSSEWEQITDEQLKPVKQLAEDPKNVEAIAFVQALKDYRELARTLTAKWADLTGMYNARDSLVAAIQQEKDEGVRLASVLADASADPSVPEIVAYMGVTWEALRRGMERLLFQANRALEYRVVSDFSALEIEPGYIGLANAFTALQFREITALEQMSSNPANFRAVISRAWTDEQKTRARPLEDGSWTIPVNITPDDFDAEFTAIRVRSVSVSLIGLEASGPIKVRIIHPGWSRIRRPYSADVLDFTHRPRATSGRLNGGAVTIEVSDNLGGEKGEFAYLSPVTEWLLKIRSEPGTSPVDLSRMERIELAFEGTTIETL